jgi:hypothetical protein
MKKRGIYGWYNLNNPEVILYVGQTELYTLEWVEDNHRNWRCKNYEGTYFRKNLEKIGENWIIKWIVKPYECLESEIDSHEKYYINKYRPKYNIDYDPGKTKKTGKYTSKYMIENER